MIPLDNVWANPLLTTTWAIPSALPTTYILSPTNEVVSKLVGIQTKATIYAELSELAIIH